MGTVGDDVMFGNILPQSEAIAKNAAYWYALIQNRPLFLTLHGKGIFQYTTDAQLNQIDKRALCLFLALLSIDTTAKDIFSDFNMDINYVCSTIFDIDEEVILDDDIDQNFVMLFQSLLNEMAEKYVCVVPEIIAYDLLKGDCCSSNVVRFVIERMISEKSLLSGDNLENYLTKRAIDSIDLYMKDYPEMKENVEKLQKEAISQFNSFFGDSKDELKLTDYGTYLTAQPFFSNPAVGRDKEIEKTLKKLMSKSVLLIGPTGVGKTALVDGIAYRIQQGNVPQKLLEKKIFMLNVSSLVAGTRYRGDFEERMDLILKKLEDERDVILFFEKLQVIKGVGSIEDSSFNFMNSLNSYLSDGSLQIIATATKDEYQNFFSNDDVFRSRFETIHLKEPDYNSLFQILDASVLKYQNEMNVAFLFENEVKKKIFDIFIHSTDSHWRVYDDMVYNPYLVLSILEGSFCCAAYHNHTQVELEDLIEAVEDCERIYPSSRERAVLKLRSQCVLEEKKLVKYKSNIILFPYKF